MLYLEYCIVNFIKLNRSMLMSALLLELSEFFLSVPFFILEEGEGGGGGEKWGMD